MKFIQDHGNLDMASVASLICVVKVTKYIFSIGKWKWVEKGQCLDIVVRIQWFSLVFMLFFGWCFELPSLRPCHTATMDNFCILHIWKLVICKYTWKKWEQLWSLSDIFTYIPQMNHIKTTEEERINHVKNT